MSNKKPKQYPYELKKQVAEEYLEGNPTSELVKKFDLSNRRRVTEWVNIVREQGYQGLEDQRGKKSKGKSKKEEKSLEEKYELACLEIEYLKKLLHLQRG